MIGDIIHGCLSMVSNLDEIAVIGVFLASAMTIAANKSYNLLVTFNTISIVAGVLLGRAALGVAGLNFSTGAVFLASAMLGLAVHHRLYGRQEAFRALENVLFGLIIVFGALFLLDRASLLSPLFDASIRKAGVRFICMYLMQSLAIHLLDKPSSLPAIVRIPAIVMLCETLEGVIFYPCMLLGDKTPALIFEFSMSSIAIRLMTTMLAVPFLVVILILQRQGVVTKCAKSA